MAFSSSGSYSSDTKVRDISITELKNKLEESLKEKDDFKLKLEKFETSSRNLTNLLNSQLSSKDKTDLGYDSPLNEKDLSNKSDVFESASDSSVNESEEDNNQANDRYKAGLNDSVFKSVISKTVTNVNETESSTSKTSKESIEKPKTVRPSAPIIKDWESDSVDDLNAAKQSSPRVAASTSTARYVNTATNRPIVNGTKPSSNVFHKSHSPARRTFNQRIAPKNSDLKDTVNTVKVNNVTNAGIKVVVSVVQGNKENAIKSSACWIWRPTGNVIDHISKDSGSYMLKRFNYVDLQGTLKSAMA
nr:hypothetical protein [Tanacetum cinerariifolium]